MDDGPAAAQRESDGVTATTSSAGQVGADDGAADETDGDAVEGGGEDLGVVTGIEAAADLPATAPETYWAVRADSYDLVQVEARTGRILADLGGWELLGDPDAGEIVQALQTVEVSTGGSLFLDDCCEPAFGTIYELQPAERFDQESSLRLNGLQPMISPNGELLMFSFGGTVQVTVADLSRFQDEGWPQLGEVDSAGSGYVPLAWIDDLTIAVRVTGPAPDGGEQIRIYELSDPNEDVVGEATLTERSEARRVAPERFFKAGATRSDGMLVVAGQRLTEEQRESGVPLGRGGDLVAEVIDPTNGELVSEFDLPDGIFDLDYDAEGRFLLASDEDGTLRWYGGGESGVLADNIIHATWH